MMTKTMAGQVNKKSSKLSQGSIDSDCWLRNPLTPDSSNKDFTNEEVNAVLYGDSKKLSKLLTNASSKYSRRSSRLEST